YEDRDHLADAGDQREYVEERHTEEVETKRRGASDDSGEYQLAAEPRADLVRHPAACTLDLRTLLARKQPHEHGDEPGAVDEQIKGEHDHRDDAEHASHKSQ